MKKTTPQFLAFTAILGLSTQAAAWWVPSDYRCTFDQITSSDQSRGRQRWAQTQAQMNKYQYKNKDGVLQPRDIRFWSSMYSTETTEAYEYNQTYLYPVYTNPDTYEPWIGPGAYNTPVYYNGVSTQFMTGTELSLLPHTVKPERMMHDGVCEPGCYTPDQQVLFESGLVSIDEAQSTGRHDLVTLSADATFDNISLTSNPVERYTVDKEAAKQEILVFRMASGGSLSVTTHHPLVDGKGSISKAMDFVVGEHLVKQDGTLDEIVSIEQTQWYGKVYNLRPVSRDLTSNILVAQGYLNGSVRYQSEYVQELNRIILRGNVPDELVLVE